MSIMELITITKTRWLTKYSSQCVNNIASFEFYGRDSNMTEECTSIIYECDSDMMRDMPELLT